MLKIDLESSQLQNNCLSLLKCRKRKNFLKINWNENFSHNLNWINIQLKPARWRCRENSKIKSFVHCTKHYFWNLTVCWVLLLIKNVFLIILIDNVLFCSPLFIWIKSIHIFVSIYNLDKKIGTKLNFINTE